MVRIAGFHPADPGSSPGVGIIQIFLFFISYSYLLNVGEIFILDLSVVEGLNLIFFIFIYHIIKEMKKVLLYGADDWGEDDEPDTLSPRSKNMNEFKELHNGTILLIGFVCGYLFRSFIN